MTEDIQQKAREKIQKEALEISLKHRRCGLGISMGVGKTRVAIQHIIKNYNNEINVLVATPTKTIKQSWLDELKKMDQENLLDHITFSTYLSINKHNPKKYTIVYLDECHSLLPSHTEFLDEFDGKIIGLTGTPPVRKGSVKYRMVEKYCPIVYTYIADSAIEDNILNDYKIVIHELSLSKIPNLKKTNKNGNDWFTSECNDYIYYSNRLRDAMTAKQSQVAAIMRMRAMMDYQTKEEYVKTMIKNLSGNCIIFANTQKQADSICKHSYHSKNSNSKENLKLFSDGTIDRLSCVLQLSEGISIPNLHQGIIMHSYGNERKSTQRIGRLLRLSPDKTAVCHILCYKDTIDEKWVKQALSYFDESKIIYYNPLETHIN